MANAPSILTPAEPDAPPPIFSRELLKPNSYKRFNTNVKKLKLSLLSFEDNKNIY